PAAPGPLARTRVSQVVLASRHERVHELVGRGDRNVEVGDPAVELALDELEDVRVVDAEDPHVSSATGSALFHSLGGTVEDPEERDRSGGAPAGRRDDVVLWAET